MLSTKKASTQIWWILASAIIAVILIFWIVPFIQRAIEPLSASFDELGDCDKDHVNNFRDQCPCLSTKGIESEKLPGCPITATKEISEKDKAEWAMFSSAALIKAMLPVLDSLEMAVATKIEEKFHGEGEYDDGIERIRNQMIEVLRQMGVESIKAVGEPVNTAFHEVIATEASGEHASGLVTKEAQRGYTMHGKVLRVAKVIVSE